MPQMTQKLPHAVDRHVGNRIRVQRGLIGVTQQQLADGLHITFQQVQKYEKGTNRVSASRLQHIASLLGVEVGFFYEGMSPVPGGSNALDHLSAQLAEVTSSPEGVRLISSFARISDPMIRRRLAALTESLAEGTAQQSSTSAAEQPQRRARGRPRKAS